MWKKQKKNSSTTGCIDTLIAADVIVEGDIRYKGGIQIDGTVKGNIIAEPDSNESLVRITRGGCIKGDLVGPNVVINGHVDGNVHCSQHLELAHRATVVGNVHYNLIEMVVGAEVNGSLFHITDVEQEPKPERSGEEEADSDTEPDLSDRSNDAAGDEIGA